MSDLKEKVSAHFKAQKLRHSIIVKRYIKIFRNDIPLDIMKLFETFSYIDSEKYILSQPSDTEIVKYISIEIEKSNYLLAEAIALFYLNDNNHEILISFKDTKNCNNNN